jgi:Protein of unknown function (DUF2796)
MRKSARNDGRGAAGAPRPWFRSFCCLLLCLGVAAVHAEGFEQHRAHEHGKVTLNVALDGPTLTVELDAPAINVVGFEHAPRTADEKTAAQRATQLVRSGRALLGFPPAADCRFQHTDFTEPDWETPEQSAAEAAGKDTEGEEHADYDATFTYKCGNPTALAWLEPWVLAKLLNVTELRINLATTTGQRSESVTSARQRVQLQ